MSEKEKCPGCGAALKDLPFYCCGAGKNDHKGYWWTCGTHEVRVPGSYEYAGIEESAECVKAQLTAAQSALAAKDKGLRELEKPSNTKVSESGVVVGDYVFASKYGDCDPSDGWAVGFAREIDGCLVTVVDNEGSNIGRPYWRHCKKITELQGAHILRHLPSLEGHKNTPALMAYVAEILTDLQSLSDKEG